MSSSLKSSKLKIYITLLSGLVFSQTAFSADNVEQLTGQSKKAIQQLGSELKTTLTATMKAKGPTAALEVCNIEAPVITANVSTEQNIEVKRTSLKPRNQLNTPDEWEQNIMRSFEQQKSDGAGIATLQESQITTIDGQRTFRYMKAIPTQEACLACHGANIKPELQKTISTLYPNDQATGFAAGDIRGAFTVKIKL